MTKFRSIAAVFLIAFACMVAVAPTTVFASKVPDEVYLGGYPVSIEMLSDGPIVRSVTENYAVNGEIKAGDVIKSINGHAVSSRSDITRIMNDGVTVPLSISVMRADNAVTVELMPEKDVCSDKLKLGFQCKDGLTGLGTVTCATADGRFYALGHPISDSDSTSRFVCRAGYTYWCEVSGIQRPAGGKPGRIIGRSVGRKVWGEIEENSDYGLRGRIANTDGMTKIKTMPRGEVKPGKAQIVTTIRSEPVFYDIEIVKASYQPSPSEKGMVIKVTDETLLKNTGGILQGMSGSPILQNGQLAGALTHVFTNDATRGYGVYTDWLIGA